MNAQNLIADVKIARNAYVDTVADFTEQQAIWKPNPASWNAVEITEHLFWAEQGGILGMWKTLLGIKAGALSYEDYKPHAGKSIETIIEQTWKEKEEVPAVAAPRQGGPLGFWMVSLLGLQTSLEAFGQLLDETDVERIAHPHPISGPMSFGQRLAFLRFHLDRHQGQVQTLKAQMSRF